MKHSNAVENSPLQETVKVPRGRAMEMIALPLGVLALLRRAPLP